MRYSSLLKTFIFAFGLSAGALWLSGARVAWPNRTSVISSTPVTEAPVPAAPAGTLADVKALSQSFISLTDSVSPTVVNIYTKSGGGKVARGRPNLPPGFEDQLQEYFGFGQGLPFNLPQMKQEALGSGFVVNAKEGYIATNAHVVKLAGHTADEIMIKFIGEENADKGHPAQVVGADDISDVALLKLVEPKPDLKAVTFGDSALTKVGEWVLAIGNPYGHTHTVTQGIVSAMGRSLEGVRSADFLQTSAGINPGNSGGPLINMNGEVIGINSAMDPRAQNIGFAIPSNTVKTVIAQLVEGGRVHRAWLGIGIEDISEEAAAYMRLKETTGVLVKQVVADAPAARAGIEAFDVIRKINGQPIHNTRDLFRTLDKLSVGKSADVEVLRASGTRALKVRLSEQPVLGG